MNSQPQSPLPKANKPPPFRYSTIELLGALLLLILSAPFIEDLPGGDLIATSLLTVVMISAVFAVGDRREVTIGALILVVPALAGKWLNHFRPDLLHPVVFLVASDLFFAYVVVRLLAFIVRAPWVNASVLCAGVAGFLMLGLLWTPAYLTVAKLNPAAFSVPANPGAPASLDGFSALYFSFITLCTVGYGDIAPVSKVARMLAMVEAICGLFYMAVLISRLVSVFSARPPSLASQPGEASHASDNPKES